MPFANIQIQKAFPKWSSDGSNAEKRGGDHFYLVQKNSGPFSAKLNGKKEKPFYCCSCQHQLCVAQRPPVLPAKLFCWFLREDENVTKSVFCAEEDCLPKLFLCSLSVSRPRSPSFALCVSVSLYPIYLSLSLLAISVCVSLSLSHFPFS